MEQLLQRFETSLHGILVEATERRRHNGVMDGNREKTNHWLRLELGHFTGGQKKNGRCRRQEAQQELSREPAGGRPESPSLLSSYCF